MAVKIIVDVNLAMRWADMLSQCGIDAIYWTDVGDGSAPDTEIMAWAEKNSRTVLTGDLDFGEILAATGQHKPSVIQIRAKDTRPEELVDLAASVITRLETAIDQGALVTIDINKTRVHLLPFVH